jgi:serine/threonine-protein kinase
LAALGEAHHLDITHRDMKPENIMLQPTRTGTDHVKVIDFGIAQLARGKRLTEFGGSLGTPEYMAPEQVRGEEVGPSADLYSVGVILFQMLTGRLPFQGGSAVETMVRQLAAPRPDPAAVASTSNISRELAAVCVQALNVDPAERFADASAFAEALEQALPAEAKGTRGLFSARSRNSLPAPPLPATAALPDAQSSTRLRLRTPVVEVEEPRAPGDTSSEFERDEWPFDLPLVGRGSELNWALEQLVQNSAGVAFCGRAGVGKTRLLREVCAAAARLDLAVAAVAADPVPLCESGYSALKRMILALSGHSSMALATGAGVTNVRVANALRVLFTSEGDGARDNSPSTALEWAASSAAERSGGKGVVLAIDDADRADGASIAVLAELLRARSVHGFSVLLTNERLPDAAMASGVALRGLRGLGVKHATRLLASKHFTGVVTRTDDIEPLYIEGLLRWHARDALPPAESLRELVERRIRSLSALERKVLLAIAALGRTSREELEAVQAEAVAGNAIKKLCESGLVVRQGSTLEAAHAVYGRVVLGLAPAETLAELHLRAADRLADRRDALELQAFHAVKGRPDVEAFLLVDEAARVRKLRRDSDGAAAILRLGLEAARARLVRGDRDAIKPLAVFGRKLGGALLDAGRLDESHAALSEALALATLPELERALLLEQLAAVESTRGRAAESERLLGECLEAAERCGDTGLIARVTNPARPARREPAPSSASPFSALRRLSNPMIR